MPLRHEHRHVAERDRGIIRKKRANSKNVLKGTSSISMPAGKWTRKVEKSNSIVPSPEPTGHLKVLHVEHKRHCTEHKTVAWRRPSEATHLATRLAPTRVNPDRALDLEDEPRGSGLEERGRAPTGNAGDQTRPTVH